MYYICVHAAGVMRSTQVWHDYSFDYHMLGNMGIACKGFAADTMHMARLWDASRRGKKNYSLESLTTDPGVSVVVWRGEGNAAQREGQLVGSVTAGEEELQPHSQT